MRRLLAIAVVLAVSVGAFALTGASEGESQTPTYQIVFDNAFGLVEGGDFRVGGVKAGQTTKFEVFEKPPRSFARVTAKVTEPGFGDFREDATCTIKPQSLIGEYFVDCQPGSSDERLGDGGRIPVSRTTSTIPLDLVGDIMRRPYRERLRLIINSLGAGVAGRPEDIQQLLRKAHPGLRETSKVLRILGDQNRTIENFIVDSDRVVEALERNKADVVRWVRETGETAAISASRRRELQANFEKLPGFLDELRPYMRRLGELTDAQTPLLTDLRRAAPDLETFFGRLGPFANASRPALDSLGESSKVGAAAFREGEEEVEELRRLAPETEPTARPLRQFLQTFDDRKRAIERDERAERSDPPAPDKTHIKGQGGFTGMETFWNYFFWQTLSLNGFDKFGTILRVSLYGDPDCEPYINNREDLAPECRQWLGPYQPGINAPDFTDGSAPSSAGRREAAAARVGERRGRGKPDAGPLPGQRDLSRPQIVLPPGLQSLIDPLSPGRRSLPLGSPPRSESNGAELLDYLLAP